MVLSRSLLPVAALALASCSAGKQAPLDSETRAIYSAVLTAQADNPAELEEWLADHPEEKHWSHGLLDQRLCVSREVAGRPGDYDMPRRESFQEAPERPDERAIFDESEQRAVLPADVITDHLRWDRMLAICPYGVLHMSLPDITDDTARLYLSNQCYGWCGWGGVIELQKVDGAWQAGDVQIRWIA